CGMGYAYKAEDRRYWIGYNAKLFGNRSNMVARITHHAHPFLVTLAHEVDETVALGFLEGIQVFIADRVSTDRAHRSEVQVGTYFDAHATSLGKALLSVRPVNEVRASYKNTRLSAYTGKTITDVESLLRELSNIKKRGYSINDEEGSPGIRSVSAPVLNLDGRAACSLAVTGPRARLDDSKMERVGILLQNVASEIVAQLARQSGDS
ncbi:MAG: IclR family transcriptional regulator, partial [Alphaproteobacteria bacterium]|nr:IclR family transcriptional regulator [Alphaproteobacteria bacterium]